VAANTIVGFDPFDPEQIADPYPAYRWMRDQAPVYYDDANDLWLVTRYDDCVKVVRDPSTFSSKLGMRRLMTGLDLGRRTSQQFADTVEPLQYLTDLRMLIAMDPPDHVRLRRLVNRAFTPKHIGLSEDWIRSLCEEHFEHLLAVDADGRADWVGDFTWPFPVMVIAELLGIPTSLKRDFKRWSDDLIGLFGGKGADAELAVTSFMELLAFFDEAIARRRAEPADDLISMLIHNAEEEDEPLSSDEMVLFCVLLLVAGNETTTNLLSNGMKVLASTPGVLERLRRQPTAIPAAVEEILRYDAPVQALPRGTKQPIELHGTSIPVASTVLVFFGAANRDERQFRDPDRFDVDRGATDHIAFGNGIHLCLGAPLARLEGRIALETLCRHVTEVELTAAPVPTEGPLLRGARSMPITLRTTQGERLTNHD
jgi:cytochrome P450